MMTEFSYFLNELLFEYFIIRHISKEGVLNHNLWFLGSAHYL